ncbi:monothiol glutaredoxin-S7, chloroplastic [Canna indica]|uniref:Monothiol glutaredoxin-S7, chloroplastic n=1 Tax=Canna indica TaxID=4628 RepID=A0AAQ3K771_9LILI|nr:monothiol glutaredoxin-S7, chloroplastic [Canna indica]
MASLATSTISARPVKALLAPLPSRTSHVATSALVATRLVPHKTYGATLISHPQRLRSRGPSVSFSVRCSSTLSPDLKSTIDKVVQSHKVVLFMKGTRDFPQCGFSNTVVQILKSLNVPFETLDILENEMLRQGMKEYSSWPTFPQLYIDGEFFGGCDIAVEAYKSGQLQEAIEKAMCS